MFGGFNKIAPRLYIGAAPPAGRRLADLGFTMVVLCAREYQWPACHFPGLRVVRAAMDDAVPTAPEVELARSAAMLAAQEVRRGGRVLITCAQGRNRSGLVSALVLRRLYGLTGDQAVHHIRGCRLGALTNSAFVHFLGCLRAPGDSALEAA